MDPSRDRVDRELPLYIVGGDLLGENSLEDAEENWYEEVIVLDHEQPTTSSKAGAAYWPQRFSMGSLCIAPSVTKVVTRRCQFFCLVGSHCILRRGTSREQN